MTGLIDLTYLHDGRWYVLDYKSNRLPGYGPGAARARRWRTASTTCRR